MWFKNSARNRLSKLIKDKSTEDKPNKDKSTKDKSTKGKLTKDKSRKDKPMEDKHTKDKSSKDKSGKDKKSKKSDMPQQGEREISLDWLWEADKYEAPKRAKKATGDWMKDAGDLV